MQKSVSWARDEPPTHTEMFEFCERLEAQLSYAEKQARTDALAEMRRFFARAVAGGGLMFQHKWTFSNQNTPEIRIDLEVLAGHACVPDRTGDS